MSGAHHGRPMETFRVRQPSVVLKMDGSLYGIGCRFFSLFESGEERLLGHSSAPTVDDMAGRPELQNTVELMAVVYGLAVLGRCGYRNCCIRIRGDSTTAQKRTYSTAFTFKSVNACLDAVSNDCNCIRGRLV